jgi:CheY-like chemotaxis protein
MSSTANLSGVKVMVIDDSNTIRRSAEIFLKQAGCEVILAEDGFDALAKIVEHSPDIIFCDIMMPRLDGYQTCSLLRQNDTWRNVQQGRIVRQGARGDGRLDGVSDQTVYARKPAAGRGYAPAEKAVLIVNR